MGAAKKPGVLDAHNKSGGLLNYRGVLDQSKARTEPDSQGDKGGPLPNPPKPPPAKLDVEVKNLTEPEAREIVNFHWERGAFRFPNQDRKGFAFPPLDLMRKDKAGTITWTGMLLTENVINNVTFLNTNNLSANLIFGPGWRMYLLAIRMATFVTKEFGGPAIIFHMGFAGRGDIQTNRHNRGVALDFAGASTRIGKLMVRNDWGSKSIPDALGGVKGKWPPGFTFTDPRFRLDPISDKTAHDFFLKMYNFAIEQCRDGSTKAPSNPGPSHPPGWNGAVVHPDYGKEGGDDGRTAHIDHIHMDVTEEFA